MMQCVATALIVLCGFLMFSRAKENQCPGDKANCPNDSTCCVLSNGSFGCCPIQNAVCCKDSVHCCPDGYTCDLIKGKCKKTAEHTNMIENIPAMSIAGEYIKGFQTKNMLQKISPLKTKVSAALNLQIVECPDGRHHCANFQTCCQAGPMSYKCCPMPNAVCCADGVHCCPGGYICDIMGRRCFPDKCKKRSEQINMIEEIQALKTSKDKCSKTDELINTIENIPAIKTSIAGECIRGVQTKSVLEKIPALKKRISAALGQIRPPPPVVCFDGSHCPFGQSCCPGPPGQGWRCCPHSPADCCSDGLHCCPPGYICVDDMRWICVRVYERK